MHPLSVYPSSSLFTSLRPILPLPSNLSLPFLGHCLVGHFMTSLLEDRSKLCLEVCIPISRQCTLLICKFISIPFSLLSSLFSLLSSFSYLSLISLFSSLFSLLFSFLSSLLSSFLSFLSFLSSLSSLLFSPLLPQFSSDGASTRIEPVASISEMNDALDKLLSDKKERELADVQDHMDDINKDFTNASIVQALRGH